jgi:hypothetical protein
MSLWAVQSKLRSSCIRCRIFGTNLGFFVTDFNESPQVTSFTNIHKIWAELTHTDGRTDGYGGGNKRAYNISLASWSRIEYWTSQKNRAERPVSTLVLSVGRLLFAEKRVLMFDKGTGIYSRDLKRTVPPHIAYQKLISYGSKSNCLPPDLLTNCLFCYSVPFSRIITQCITSYFNAFNFENLLPSWRLEVSCDYLIPVDACQK